MQTRPSGMKSAPRLAPFRRVTRCDIGVSATGSLLQLCVLCTFSEVCNYCCHVYRQHPLICTTVT